MAELAVADVVGFTGGRLVDSGPTGETARMLTAALSVARRETQWPVSPARTETITIDGPGSRVLWLPTLKLNSLNSVSEDGTVLDVSTVAPSAGDGPDMLRRVSLRKKSKGWWSAEYGAVVIAMNHGFTEVQAADWRQAILSMVDQMSLLPVKASGMSNFGQTRKEVDDVVYGWAPYAAMAEEVIFSISSIINKYRLPDVEFM